MFPGVVEGRTRLGVKRGAGGVAVEGRFLWRRGREEGVVVVGGGSPPFTRPVGVLVVEGGALKESLGRGVGAGRGSMTVTDTAGGAGGGIGAGMGAGGAAPKTHEETFPATHPKTDWSWSGSVRSSSVAAGRS